MSSRYRTYQVEDFAADDSFIQWILHPDATNQEAWEQFLRDYPEKQQAVKKAAEIVRGFTQQEKSVPASDIQQGWDEIATYLERTHAMREQKEEAEPANYKAGKTISLFSRSWSSIAAAATLLIGLGAAFFTLNRMETTHYASQEVEEIRLPDNSRVLLNKGSELTHKQFWFFRSKRNVSLDGEAFFNVEKQRFLGRGKTFTVQTNDLRVEVLGTRFNVNTHDERTDVLLAEGSIKLHFKDMNSSVVMEPGDYVDYSRKTHHWSRTSNVNPNRHIRWTEESSSDFIEVEKPGETTSKKATGNFAGSDEEASQESRVNARQTPGSVPDAATSPKENEPTSGSYPTIGQESDGGNLRGGNAGNAGRKGGFGGTNQPRGTAGTQTAKKTKEQSGGGNNAKVSQKGDGNEAYIEQIHSSNHALIEQQGENLRSQQIQEGKENQAEVKFEGDNLRTESDDKDWSSQQIQEGKENKSFLIFSKTRNTNVYTEQQGEQNYASVETEGANNEVDIEQKGTDNRVTGTDYWDSGNLLDKLKKGVMQKGNRNTTIINQQNSGNRATVNQQGDNNTAKIKQNGNQ